MSKATTVAVPQSIEGRLLWGRVQVDKNVVYRQVSLIREDINHDDVYTVMITRFPHGDFGYMVSIDGHIRYAQQFYHLEDVADIAQYLVRKYKQEQVDLIVCVLQDLINDYAKKDKKTGYLKLSN
jgi:hypothetical protein